MSEFYPEENHIPSTESASDWRRSQHDTGVHIGRIDTYFVEGGKDPYPVDHNVRVEAFRFARKHSKEEIIAEFRNANTAWAEASVRNLAVDFSGEQELGRAPVQLDEERVAARGLEYLLNRSEMLGTALMWRDEQDNHPSVF